MGVVISGKTTFMKYCMILCIAVINPWSVLRVCECVCVFFFLYSRGDTRFFDFSCIPSESYFLGMV